jgi:hypothetical protein
MISERLLRQWRRDALHFKKIFYSGSLVSIEMSIKTLLEMQDRILRLTQELSDNYLMRGEKAHVSTKPSTDLGNQG